MDSWKLNKEENLTLRQTRTKLLEKRNTILKRLGKRSAMDKWKTQDFLKYDPRLERKETSNQRYGKTFSSVRSLERQIVRYRTNANRILHNVCNGEFPGQYSS